MVTGEGKTLVATLPAYLNALDGQGRPRRHGQRLPRPPRLRVDAAHLQRARRHRPRTSSRDMDPEARRQAYECDITYGTNSEFGFDYLRDNMKIARFDDEQLPPVLPPGAAEPLNYAIIDEVDNILIDEARTPLIISGPAFSDAQRFDEADKVARQLTELERKARRS